MTPSKSFIAVSLASALLAACSQGAAPEDRPIEAAAASAVGERFYDRDSFTIEYQVSGDASGTIVEHARNWGKQRAEIQDTHAVFFGVATVQKSRKVIDGAQTYNFDDVNGTLVSGPTPFYQEFVDASRGATGVEIGKSILRAMGAVETGETGAFAGESCAFWETSRLATRACITDWGGTLYSAARIGQLTLERTAIAVRIGDGGPDAAFSTAAP